MISQLMKERDRTLGKAGSATGVRINGEHEMLHVDTKIVQLDFFDGELVIGGFTEARYRQYDGHEMYTMYFRRATGEILRISRRFPGDY